MAGKKTINSVEDFVDLASNDVDENGILQYHFSKKDREFIREMMKGARIVRNIFISVLGISFICLLIYYISVKGGVL